MTTIDINPSVYLVIILNGLFTGLGSALGSYFANKHIIEKLKRLTRKVRRFRK